MTEDKDRNADKFLDLIKRSRRGKFKVYIGMIAGVGKSYRMLKETKALLHNGVDVQIGYIETHGRIDTERVLEGLPVIPRKKVYYKGKELEEMDLQSILNHHPEVVIIDELAHTNVPGCQNEKRWQDVVEILDAGINVISAVNIQHIEGLYGDIEKIAGIKVKERIPDLVLQMADEIVNIDLTADELIERLREGKIYDPSKVEMAINNFFQPDKILQLRELALKEVAGQVERKIEAEVFVDSKRKTEKFLACISANYLMGRKIIRKTSRMANFYSASWVVLYVQTPGEEYDKISLSVQRHLINNLNLATELKAEVVQIQSKHIADSIVQVAHEKEITTVLVGLPKNSLLKILGWKNVLRNLLNKLAGTKIDIIIVS